MFRGTTEGDLTVILLRRMEAIQVIGSAHSSPVTGLEFSKHGRYLSSCRGTVFLTEYG